MNDTVAFSNAFPVEDISHKPKRMQGDAIRQKESEANPKEANTPETAPKSGSYTLERAIQYYEEHSSESPLYQSTARWLKQLLLVKNYELKEAMAEAKLSKDGEENEDTSEEETAED